MTHAHDAPEIIIIVTHRRRPRPPPAWYVVDVIDVDVVVVPVVIITDDKLGGADPIRRDADDDANEPRIRVHASQSQSRVHTPALRFVSFFPRVKTLSVNVFYLHWCLPI